ncbi:hypothetical protein DFJ77DRAFT_539341 [Powellomyces hirtus]|nr:hypothetical protein DFJ77DRAFT_539341 [Powellomyces hirtus]
MEPLWMTEELRMQRKNALIGGSLDSLLAMLRQAPPPAAPAPLRPILKRKGTDTHRRAPAQQPQQQDVDHDLDAGLEFGEKIREAADRAIEAGVRRRTLRGPHAWGSLDQLRPDPVVPPAPVQLKPSILASTNRLADPEEFPACYKHRYQAVKERKERFAQAAATKTAGGIAAGKLARSMNDLNAPLPKRVEDVVQRLTDPKNYTGTHVARREEKEVASAAEMEGEERERREGRRRARKLKPRIEFFTDFAPRVV